MTMKYISLEWGFFINDEIWNTFSYIWQIVQSTAGKVPYSRMYSPVKIEQIIARKYTNYTI